ncbi:MAG: hypothetical protein WD042_02880 [Phycisphaeraceae bacterium]
MNQAARLAAMAAILGIIGAAQAQTQETRRELPDDPARRVIDAGDAQRLAEQTWRRQGSERVIQTEPLMGIPSLATDRTAAREATKPSGQDASVAAGEDQFTADEPRPSAKPGRRPLFIAQPIDITKPAPGRSVQAAPREVAAARSQSSEAATTTHDDADRPAADDGSVFSAALPHTATTYGADAAELRAGRAGPASAYGVDAAFTSQHHGNYRTHTRYRRTYAGRYGDSHYYPVRYGYPSSYYASPCYDYPYTYSYPSVYSTYVSYGDSYFRHAYIGYGSYGCRPHNPRVGHYPAWPVVSSGLHVKVRVRF